jgi:hypothetical protein
MRFEIKQYSANEWELLAQVSHFLVFDVNRPAELNRIDYALLIIDKEKDCPCGFITIRELDADSVYWQYGGAMPQYQKSIAAFSMFESVIEWTKVRYKRMSTLVKNDNFPMLKFYMRLKAKVIGCRNFHGEVFLEHLLEF